jgi:hypothetical protein
MKSIGYFFIGLVFVWIGLQAIGSEATQTWPMLLKIVPFGAAGLAFFSGLWEFFSRPKKKLYVSPGWSPYANPQTGIPLALSKGKEGRRERKLMR